MREGLRVLRDALLFFILVDFPSREIGKIKKGIPRSAERGQPARLDRAGPRARTRLSPAGGIYAPKISSFSRIPVGVVARPP